MYSRLIGEWKTSGILYTNNQNVNIYGKDSYEYILDDTFILHKASVMIGNERSETLELIQPFSSLHSATFSYFNSRGESGTMFSTIDGNQFLIEGNQLKFDGIINDDNRFINGKWFNYSDNEWNVFIEINLEKI